MENILGQVWNAIDLIYQLMNQFTAKTIGAMLVEEDWLTLLMMYIVQKMMIGDML